MGTGNGKVYVLAYDGYVYAYNADDGTLEWKFYSGDAGLDTGRGVWPWWANPAITSDKVYASTGEHTFTNPRYMGNRMYCIDDNTGQEIWSIAGSWGGKSVGENKLLAYSDYTGEMFCFGRGPTATTVTAPENVVQKGIQVLIKGSVTDQSPATKSGEVAVRFPEGVPAVSENVMSEYMEYLYMQRPIPADIEGVTVKLTAVDPNGNTQAIGTVTTDSAGMFKKLWMPPVEGEYTVHATFDGSTSYWPSKGQTAFGIGPAPEPTPPPPDPTPAPMTDTYVLGMGAAAIIVIIVFGILILLMLRKR
jgi:hypothetical protein